MSTACFGDGAPVLVSACLLGEPCRYDGGSASHPAALRLLEAGRAVPVCPELLGGLPTPRALWSCARAAPWIPRGGM